jgi:hypothetical protein
LLEEERDGHAGQFEAAALAGCGDGEFLDSLPVEN